MPPSSVSPEESREAFDARLAGATLWEIADGLGFSVEGARRLLAREADRQLTALEAKLLESGSVELAIPADGDQLQAVLAHVRWAAGELAARGLRVRPFIRAGFGGLAIGLEEHAPEEGR